MGKYSIKELEQLSGIKAHTIRIWEKRHQLVEPERTTTNIRLYSDDDLKKIINISLLNTHGLKISKLVNLSAEELHQKVSELSETKSAVDIFIDQMVVAMIDMEEEAFDQLLNRLSQRLGFERALTEVVYPFLTKIGVLWQTGNITPAQEHFISNLIRQKIIVAIDSLPLAPKSAMRVVLYLPEGELHEIGLLFYHYVAKKEGLRTYYLGQNVPYKDVAFVVEQHKPHVLVTSITTSPTASAIQGYIDRLAADFPNTKILASGAIVRKVALKFPPNFHVFDNAVMLRKFLSAGV
jgi:DNA-binding transcriptional MerR regulator/methylmalonyl-CoA mutase cobalamin-binding subunit